MANHDDDNGAIEHRTELQHEQADGELFERWRVACACGFRGVWRLTQGEADKDARGHLRAFGIRD